MTMTTVLEQCQIPPPANEVVEFSLPLLFFDLLWWRNPASQNILFFDFPNISKSHFLDTVVPNLKHSLSLTLNHFLPLAGKIIHPLTSGKPISLYTVGDSVSLTIAESAADFNHLTGNHPRDSRELFSLVANLPPAVRSSDAIKVPVLALQVTLFPENGVCFGITIHHVIGDARTLFSFIQTWASINKFNGDYSNHCLLPSFDRKNVEDINGLDSFYWDSILSTGGSLEPRPINPPTDKLRATFLLKEDDIKKLKTFVSANQPSATDVSSFTVTCALIWVCFAKSNAVTQTEDHDELEYFSFTADCRERLNLNPPLPATYFGNCVALVMKVKLDPSRLKGRDGILIAAEMIGKTIRDQTIVHNKDTNVILHDARTWLTTLAEGAGKRRYVVAGSPRFDFYGVDYGWGRPKKFEVLVVDDGGPCTIISLCRSREGGGSLEIGISGSETRVHSFATAFTEILENLSWNIAINKSKKKNENLWSKF